MTTKVESPRLIYQGSVKSVYQSPTETDRLWFSFSDDYSVFDWGKMPDQIEAKGFALTIMAGYFFETFAHSEFWSALPKSRHLSRFDQKFRDALFDSEIFKGQSGLAACGLASHYRGIASSDGTLSLADAGKSGTSGPPLYLDVEEAAVLRPTTRVIGGSEVYFYERPAQGEKLSLSFIPLEIVFRFGAPPGSSLIKRAAKEPHYLSTLGLGGQTIAEGDWFERPVLEFFTKLESSDRLLSYQEAALTAGLSADEFSRLYDTGLCIALGLYHIFAEREIELFDGKVEMAVSTQAKASGKRALYLADSVGPDELRLNFGGVQLSKEVLRDYYRQSQWYAAIEKAKEMAKSRPGAKWQDICRLELKAFPEPLSTEFKSAVSRLYLSLAESLSAVKLAGAVPLSAVQSEILSLTEVKK